VDVGSQRCEQDGHGAVAAGLLERRHGFLLGLHTGAGVTRFDARQLRERLGCLLDNTVQGPAPACKGPVVTSGAPKGVIVDAPKVYDAHQ